MQVTNVRTTVVGTPWRELVFVELETDTGLTGVGEVRPVNKTDSFIAVVEELAARYVIGADPFDTERLAWAIERLEYGRPGEHGQSALAAFDIASFDLIGQHLGVPVWKLLGGRFRDRVPAYANGWYQADLEPARIAELAVAVVARGYRAMKLDPFGAASVRISAPDRRRAIAVVAAVREAIGPDIDLMIEMHGRFSPDTAAQIAVALEPYAPRWIEEPVPPENAAALARVRRSDRDVDRDRRADPCGLGRGAVHRGRQRRHHPGGSQPLRRVHRHAPPRGLDRGALPDPRAAQRRRAGRHRRQRPPRGGDAQRRHRRAFQRLRRRVGERARRHAPRQSTRSTAASRSPTGRVSASGSTTKRAPAIRGHRPDSACSRPAGRSARAPRHAGSAGPEPGDWRDTARRRRITGPTADRRNHRCSCA